MPGLTDDGENNVLDAIYNFETTGFPAGNPFVALHTGDPGDTGAANEVSGGPGPYARQQAGFSVAASGATANEANIDFTGMPATTVVAWSIWSLVTAGTCYQTGWLSTVSGLGVVRSGDLAGNTVQTYTSPALSTDDRVVFETIEGLTAPAGITLGTLYFVLAGATTDAFTFSATSGGAAIDITAAGAALWRKVTPKTTNSGDTFRIAANDLDILATE